MKEDYLNRSWLKFAIPDDCNQAQIQKFEMITIMMTTPKNIKVFTENQTPGNILKADINRGDKKTNS